MLTLCVYIYIYIYTHTHTHTHTEKSVYLPTQSVNKIAGSVIIGGYALAQLVEALRYESEGHGFDSRWCHENFSLT